MITGYKSELMDFYDKVRSNEKKELNKRIEEMKKLHPEIMALDKKIGVLCSNVALMAIKKSDNKELEMAKMRDTIEDLRCQKSEALVASNYSPDYLSLNYRCKKCKDTGYIGIKKCSCYHKNLVNIYYKKSEISELLNSNNFSNFTLEYYRANKLENERISPKENMQMIVSRIQDSYLKDFKNTDTNLLFLGDSGTGKSFLSHCIAKDLMDKGFLVLYRTSDELLKDLKDIRFNNNKELEQLLLNCDLLIIDDLGTEQITDFSLSETFTFINNKLLKKKRMLISTNLSISSLKDNYGERINSRLLGNFIGLTFFGDDIRIEMKKRRKRSNS